MSPPARPASTAGPSSRLSATTACLLGAVLLLACLTPALLNRSPPVFTDTQGYLNNMQVLRPSHARAFGYGAWLRATGGTVSLWLPALAQALVVSWLVARLLTLEAPRWPPRLRLPAAAGLVAVLLAGHLPWLTSWLMPDLFAGLLLLALLLLAEHWAELPRWERALVVLFLCGAATMHLTHPPLLFGLGLFALAFGFGPLPVARRVAASARRVAAAALLAAACGWGALTAANLITYKQASPSLGSPVFLFAALVEDADVPAILRPHCERQRAEAGAPWAVCAHLDRLRGITEDEFLWDGRSPLQDLGDIAGFYPEARELLPILLRAAWPDWLAASAGRALRQMARFGLGDGMDDQGPRMVARDAARFGLPWVAPIMAESRQYRNELLPLMPHGVAEATAAAGLLGLAALAGFGLLRRQPELWWPALLFLVAWFGNAAVIALAAPVHDRYGARLVWVAPLLALLLVLRIARPAAAPVAPPGVQEQVGAERA